MKFFKSHFAYSKSQRNGIFILVILCVGIQLFICGYQFKNKPIVIKSEALKVAEKELAALRVPSKKIKQYSFNPNYLSDVKAYRLGMSVKQIDRLFAFRNKGKYINSAKDFQQVTQVSDSLLATLAVDFKFPKWVTSKSKKSKKKVIAAIVNKQQDINTTTAKQLVLATGISYKQANTLVKYRRLLKGFSKNVQLAEVWGINKKEVDKIMRSFKIITTPKIIKLNVNIATINQLKSIVYISYKQAKSIVAYREEVAEIQNLAELKTIRDFPVDKFDLISLYLQAQ